MDRKGVVKKGYRGGTARRKPRNMWWLEAKERRSLKGYLSDLTDQLVSLSREILVEIWLEKLDWNGSRSGCK